MTLCDPNATESATVSYRGSRVIVQVCEQFRREGRRLRDLEEALNAVVLTEGAILDLTKNERTGALNWTLQEDSFIVTSVPKGREEISFRGRLELDEGILTYNSGYGEDAFLTALVAMLPDPELATFTIHFGQKGYPTTWTLETENHLFTRKVNAK